MFINASSFVAVSGLGLDESAVGTGGELYFDVMRNIRRNQMGLTVDDPSISNRIVA